MNTIKEMRLEQDKRGIGRGEKCADEMNKNNKNDKNI